jgi:Bacterial PH domain
VPPAVTAAVTAVPRRMRLVCAVVAAVVLVVTVVVGALLKSSSTGVVSFHTSDQVAMIVLGVLLAAGILLLGRPRVDADDSGVRVRNILGSHDLPWAAVRSVRFDRSSPWATLLLVTGEEVAVLAVQAADRERAVAAVEGLRALLAANRPPEPPRPPLLYDD